MVFVSTAKLCATNVSSRKNYRRRTIRYQAINRYLSRVLTFIISPYQLRDISLIGSSCSLMFKDCIILKCRSGNSLVTDELIFREKR